MWILVIDFGLVILIWMTQLIVYPAFTKMEAEALVAWHPTYTSAISILVMPLMLLQLGLHGWDLITSFAWIRAATFLLIIGCWMNTFLQAVPLHNQISSGQSVMLAADQLVKVNWYRTILWSLVFLMDLLYFVRTPG